MNTMGILVAFVAFMAFLFLALDGASFVVNHIDNPAGIVMGFSNTTDTLAKIVGVDLTGKPLEATK